MKKLLSLIAFVILTSTYYSQSIKVDLKNNKLLNKECLIVEESNFASIILIDSVKVGHLYYDTSLDTSKVYANSVRVSIEFVFPSEFIQYGETISNIIYNEVCNQYLIKLKTDLGFSKKRNSNPFFHKTWSNSFTEDKNYKLIELSKNDYIDLSSKFMKRSGVNRTVSKLLTIGGVVVVVISPASFIVGGIAGVTALIVDLTSDEQLRKSAKYLKSASNTSE
jgi:hypothetical protein